MNMLIWLISDSMSPALSTYTAQNIGAGKYGRVKKGTLLGTGLSCASILLISLILYVFCGSIGQWFLPSSDAGSILPLIVRYTRMMAPFFVFYALAESFSGSCCGMGDTLKPMAVTLMTVCILRIVCIWFILPHYATMECIVSIYITSWIASGISFTVMYLWKQHAITKKQFSAA